MIRNKDIAKKILLEQIKDSGIDYRYFLTIDYPYKQTNYNNVISDNRYLRRLLRKFYKSDIHMIFFIEKHMDTASNHYGGYHRHILVEDAPESRWMYPANSMVNFMLNIDVEQMFAMKMRIVPSNEYKKKLLCKVVRDLCDSAPNGYLGTNVLLKDEDKGGIEGLVGYGTKQIDMVHPAYEVVDPTSSDINARPLLDMYI